MKRMLALLVVVFAAAASGCNDPADNKQAPGTTTQPAKPATGDS